MLSDAAEPIKQPIRVPDEMLRKTQVYNESAGGSSYNLITDVTEATIKERAISKRLTNNAKIFSKPGPSRETMVLPPGWRQSRFSSKPVNPSLDVITLNDADDVDWKARMKYTRKNLQSKLSKKTNFPTARPTQFANCDVIEIDVDEKAPVNKADVFNKENRKYNRDSSVESKAIKIRNVGIPEKTSKFGNYFPPTTVPADEKSRRIAERIRSRTMTPFPDNPAIQGEDMPYIYRSEESVNSSLPSGTMIQKRKVNYVRDINSVYPNLDNRPDYSAYPLLDHEETDDMAMMPSGEMIIGRTNKRIRKPNFDEEYPHKKKY